MAHHLRVCTVDTSAVIVASLIAALGFFGAAYVTQTRGLRLGGTIVVPTLAVYALWDFLAIPIFVGSAVLGYYLLGLAKERTLIYGRDEFVVGLLAGTLVPLAFYLGLELLLPGFLAAHPVVFVGSILPGLAAFNFQQVKPEYRRVDVLYTAGAILALVALGALLVNPWTARTIGHLTPAVLFSATADIAVLRSAVVDGPLAPNVDVRPVIVGVLTIGFVVGELTRRRYGVRLGLVSLALLAIFALASRWLVVLFIPALVVSYAVVWVVHRRALLYGRVLIGVGCGAGVLTVLLLAGPLPIVRGFSAFFVGVIAGVDAYNLHATPPVERRQAVPLALAIVTLMLFLARAVSEPTALGVLQTVTPLHLVGGALVVIAGFLLAERVRVAQPSDEAVLSASVLSGGDGA